MSEACPICPIRPPEGQACYPTPAEQMALGETAIRITNNCAFERLNTDELTGLPNYGGFQRQLYNTLSHARSTDVAEDPTTHEETRPGGFLFIDGNGVHELNGIVGHDTVDEGICGLADILRDSLRQTDLRCRRSGDEFIVYLPGEEKSIIAVRDRLQERLAVGVPLGSTAHTLSARVHMEVVSDVTSFDQAMTVIKKADIILTARKRRTQDGRPR